MEEKNTGKGVLTLTDRKIFKMDGVIDIAAFDEECVLLNTEIGRITVEGNGLKIECLSENGDILIKGNISGIFCADVKNGRKGIFGGLFS